MKGNYKHDSFQIETALVSESKMEERGYTNLFPSCTIYEDSIECVGSISIEGDAEVIQQLSDFYESC